MDTDSGAEVLVVDDTAESLTYLCELLESHGYSVRAAPNGELALWTAAGRTPDLILLDVRMPDMDGFEVCRRLKADARTAAVPVIFLSAQGDLEDKIRGFGAGGVDYVGKPFASEEVLQRVATHLKLAHMNQALEREKASLERRVRERTAQLEDIAHALRQEIAAHNVAQDKLRLAANAFEASLSSMFIAGADRIILAVNPAFTSVTGYEDHECIGRDAHFLNDVEKHDESFFADMWVAVNRDGKWTGEVWNRRKDGNEFPCLYTVSSIKNLEGNVVNYVGVFLDLSENKDAQTLIEFLTHHDPLTGLPNRILVRDRFMQLINDTHPAETLAVICVNLDRFRHLNDFHGYGVGNQILQWVARELGEFLPSKDTIFRESGDEFILVHRDDSGLLGIRMLLESILARLNTEMTIDDLHIALSVSLGVALYPNDGTSLENLVANAALAMARIKDRGGGTYAFFTEDIDHGVRLRFDLAQRLRHALERSELEIYFQPQVEAGSGRIVAAEALLRWRSPELGFVSPAQFIPIAEETGCIVPIGEWVLHSVCAQIAAWQAQGLSGIKVAVNLSAHQFMRENIAETVALALGSSRIAASCLELEITESAIIDDVPRAIATMRELKELGVFLSLDDFGTGYSSLSYLKKFPIDYLKIDQSFVRDLIRDGDADAIVLSIIGLARNMRLNVVAEGVETPEQREFLAAHGCDLLQGYLFGKPLPAPDFRKLLAAQSAGAAIDE